MADALCGPSNALQNFQKHASVDRTLQQDRFVSRPGPSQQGFRSDVGHSAGRLDPEFEAFQAGLPHAPPDLHQAFPLPHESFHRPPHAPLARAPPDGWASDFAQLQISNQPPSRLHQQPQFAPHQSPMSWRQNFHSQQQPQTRFESPMNSAPQFQPRSTIMHGANSSQAYEVMPPGMSIEQVLVSRYEEGRKHMPPDQLKELTAFEREFIAAASAASPQVAEDVQQEPLEATKDVGLTENAQASQLKTETESREITERQQIENLRASLGDYGILGPPGIYKDLSGERVEEETRQEDQQQQQPPLDDLAETARELLERVSDNTSQKFQESSFLAFMREIRDGEKRIENGEVVDVQRSGQEANEQPYILPDERDEDSGRIPMMAGALHPNPPAVNNRPGPSESDVDRTAQSMGE